tara:strand:- start:200 stop:343 length:144 start_codon:yes stop_codon:yes gene_type:complete
VVIGDVSQVFHLWPVVGEYGGGEFLDLGKPLRLPSEGFPGEAGGFDA